MEETILQNYHWWLIAGCVFLTLEALAIPGIGFLFAGLAAFAVSILVTLGLAGDGNIFAELAWFFGLTAFFALLLWKPLKRFRQGRVKEYHNIKGESGKVISETLVKGEAGEVEWSGTRMRARLSPDSPVDSLIRGMNVRITEIEGNTLTVIPE